MSLTIFLERLLSGYTLLTRKEGKKGGGERRREGGREEGREGKDEVGERRKRKEEREEGRTRRKEGKISANNSFYLFEYYMCQALF